MSIIIVSPTNATMARDEIADALYGTPIPYFDTNTGNFVGTRRDERRVFHESRNTRVSAVGYYEWTAFDKGMAITEIMYHNPFPLGQSIHHYWFEKESSSLSHNLLGMTLWK